MATLERYAMLLRGIDGGIVSEFLCLGVQVSGAESGEATIVTPLNMAKLGSKLF